MKTLYAMRASLLFLAIIQTTRTLPGPIGTTPITFQRVGTVVTSVTDFLLVGNVDLEPLEDELAAVEQTTAWLMNATTNVSSVHPAERKVIKAQIALLKREIVDILFRVRQLQFMFQPQESRTKRSVLLALGASAIIGASIGSLLHSSYMEDRLDAVESGQADMIKYVDLTTQLAADNQHRIDLINKTLHHLVIHEIAMTKFVTGEVDRLRDGEKILLAIDTCQSSILHLHNAVDRLIQIYSMALRGHISTELITPTQAKWELSYIQRNLPQGMRPAVSAKEVTNFFKLNCHLVSRGNRIQIVVAIPVFAFDQEFSLYKYLGGPIPLEDGISMKIAGQTSFLVINKPNTLHAELTAEQVQMCTRINNLFLCPHARILSKDNKPSCLYLLFKGRVSDAKVSCEHRFHIAGVLEFSQVTETDFVATAASPQTITRHCGQNVTGYTFQIPKGITYLKLQPGCSLTGQGCFITPGHNSSITTEQFLVNTGSHLPIKAYELLQEHYPEVKMEHQELTATIRDLAKGGASVSLKDVVAARAIIHRPGQGLHIWSSVFTAFSLLITAAFFTWVFYKYYCGGKKRTPTSPKRNTEVRELEDRLASEA